MQLVHQLTPLQFKQVFSFLSERSYWSKAIDETRLKKAIEHSMCFALVDGKQLLAFCRVVTDHVTFANLLDVLVLEPYRGQGVGKKLIDAVMTHPELQGLRRFTLATKGAHSLYQQFGFNGLANPDIAMEKYVTDIYCNPFN